MIKKILIIGGNGFLGFNIAKKLKSKNYSIVILCKKKPEREKFIKKIKYLYCNINNFQKLKKKIVQDFDCVINFSGNINHNNKKQVYDIHFNGFKNILKLVENKNIKLFIQAGSSLEYGKQTSPQKEKNTCQPISYYGKAKYLASRYLMKRKTSFSYIILRMYQIYGPYQKNNRLVPHIVNSCLGGKKFKCTSGKQKRDFLYVEDLNNLLIKIIKKKKIKSGIYNVGRGKPITVKKIIEKINFLIKKGQPIFGGLDMRKDEVMSLYPNINKVKKYFNWQPKIGLISGLKKTIKFYEKK